ncbi:unnamed protein product, partial [Anisakis simplex]|uniref:Dehydrin n=1 Tax=Anisakis simplex TaxID=6269 RepID=A0A0M3J760_ANISI
MDVESTTESNNSDGNAEYELMKGGGEHDGMGQQGNNHMEEEMRIEESHTDQEDHHEGGYEAAMGDEVKGQQPAHYENGEGAMGHGEADSKEAEEEYGKGGEGHGDEE